MNTNETQQPPNSPDNAPPRGRLLWIVLTGSLVVLIMGLFLRRPETKSSEILAPKNSPPPAATPSTKVLLTAPAARRRNSETSLEPAKPAEQIVAEKVLQFAHKRRDLIHKIERRLKKKAPPEVERFFDALDSGNWDQINSQWKEMAKLSGQYENSTGHSEDLNPFWATVLDAYGVAEQAHLWPAQNLLDYGNAVLGSLRPGMVYVGGTDPGRWVPELLNETSDGDQHIIVTQNAFADGRYLDFVSTLYGDQFATLSQDDSQKAFADYTADAQKRLEHDQQFPNEPKQVLPGENISNSDGRIQVSGQVAVMAINERLLQALMQKNPDLSFALQESFPMRGTYASAAPLGPIMELNAQGGQDAFTADRANDTLSYWSSMTQNFLADPGVTGSEDTVKAWSKDANAAANLLAAHNYSDQAEQTYRLASQLSPGNLEAATGLAQVLEQTGHPDQARQVLDAFAQNYPDQQAAAKKAWDAVTISGSAPASKP